MPDVRKAMEADGPLLVSVTLDAAQGFEPRIRSRQLEDGTIVTPALDDMYPFLSQEELASNRYPED